MGPDIGRSAIAKRVRLANGAVLTVWNRLTGTPVLESMI